MLPETLSGDLCSLHEGVDRPCIAVRIVLDADGNKRGHRFVRGLMRSRASLTYGQAQAAADGTPDAITEPLLDTVIRPLWAAFAAADRARAVRAPLNLDLPERRIILDDDGKVVSVAFRERLAAHKLIEDFMILANVAAAETLEEKRLKLLYRVHEEPSVEKLDALRQVVESVGMSLAKGQVLKTAQLNRLLDGVAGTEHAEMINISVLRSMTQAYYAPENFGHFGLNLRSYGHFTSPIRRYADLVVHRALIRAHRWGDDGLTPADEANLAETGEHISMTERRSMLAERDTTDRYLAAFLSDRVGSEFEGTVSGVARFGLFVKLDDTGADGLDPDLLARARVLHLRRRQPDPDRREVAPRDRPRPARHGAARRGRADHRRAAVRVARARGPQHALPAPRRRHGRAATQARPAPDQAIGRGQARPPALTHHDRFEQDASEVVIQESDGVGGEIAGCFGPDVDDRRRDILL